MGSTSDYYRVRISYRPVRGFQGEPGMEIFTIDKAGPIRLRQILSDPQPNKKVKPAYFAAGTLTAAAVVIVILFTAGVFSSSSGDVVNAMVDPGVPLKAVSAEGGVTVDLEAGSVSASSELEYRPLSTSQIPVLPAQYKATDTAFDLTMDATLLKPLTITVRLSAADATAAGGIESNLIIQHYQEGDSVWEALPTTVDFGASTAQAQVDSLSKFALTINNVPAPTPTDTPTLLPATNTPTPTPTDTPVPAQPTPTDTPTLALIPTPTPKPAPTATPVPTPVPTLMPTPLPTDTPTPVPTEAPAPTPTTPAPLPTSVPTYALEATVQPGGLGRIGLNPSSDDGRYAIGRRVRVTASCDHRFQGWTGDLPAGTDPFANSIIVTVDQKRNLVARCAEPTGFPLTINGETLDPGQLMLFVLNGKVTVSQSPGPDGKLDVGSRVLLQATPDQACFDVTWSGVDTVDRMFAWVEMREDREVEAAIERPVYTLATSANPLNGGVVTGGGQYLCGTQAVL